MCCVQELCRFRQRRGASPTGWQGPCTLTLSARDGQWQDGMLCYGSEAKARGPPPPSPRLNLRFAGHMRCLPAKRHTSPSSPRVTPISEKPVPGVPSNQGAANRSPPWGPWPNLSVAVAASGASPSAEHKCSLQVSPLSRSGRPPWPPLAPHSGGGALCTEAVVGLSPRQSGCREGLGSQQQHTCPPGGSSAL